MKNVGVIESVALGLWPNWLKLYKKISDHDWEVAPSHKLIPSVYAWIVKKQNGVGVRDAVSYSGHTYIAIRSGKDASQCSQIVDGIYHPPPPHFNI